MQTAAIKGRNSTVVVENKKDKKVSWKKKFVKYIKENQSIIAPAIFMMNGSYYRPMK